MSDYRDYGCLDGAASIQVEVQPHYSQVYKVTHDGAGKYLPHMNRSFISFSYGGKNIEDFNLIVSIENNSLNRKAYANFKDNITESDTWDGQIYWSSHYNENSIQFTLVTDEMTEEQLDNFSAYFIPGKIEELILSEHPNRAIMARISEPPVLDLLPFEKVIITKIMEQEYETSTTFYKGKIIISFIMDDPFWYSRTNILDLMPDGSYDVGKWINANNELVSILEDKDALKIIYEDGVPFSSMSIENVLFGVAPSVMIDYSSSPTGSRIANANDEGALIDLGHIFYVLLNPDSGINIGPNTNGYFYYAGNAPSRPRLIFSITPTLNSDGYIDKPLNSFVNGITPYNKIFIKSKKQQEFRFTTPGIWTGYNQVISIFKREDLINVPWEQIREAIRDNVKHWAPRQYANLIISQVGDGHEKTSSTLLENCITSMQNFLKNDANPGVIAPAVFEINCNNGQAVATFTYRNQANVVTSSAENVGDMACSDYFILEEKNVLNPDGYIDKWQEGHNDYSYKVWADCTLSNFNLQYKYKYL